MINKKLSTRTHQPSRRESTWVKAVPSDCLIPQHACDRRAKDKLPTADIDVSSSSCVVVSGGCPPLRGHPQCHNRNTLCQHRRQTLAANRTDTPLTLTHHWNVRVSRTLQQYAPSQRPSDVLWYHKSSDACLGFSLASFRLDTDMSEKCGCCRRLLSDTYQCYKCDSDSLLWRVLRSIQTTFETSQRPDEVCISWVS